jgi:prevent-host-death family protein
MARARWSLEQAKNSFSAVVEAARRGRPQTVTRHGKPAVVIVAVEDYERLRQSECANAPRFTDYLLSMPSDGQDERPSSVKLRDVAF